MTDILGMLWGIEIDWFSNIIVYFVCVIIVLQFDENISLF